MNSRITLQELQMVEVNVLNEFIKFCDDNDLKYFVVYGTLLGTIRHNGISMSFPRRRILAVLHQAIRENIKAGQNLMYIISCHHIRV